MINGGGAEQEGRGNENTHTRALTQTCARSASYGHSAPVLIVLADRGVEPLRLLLLGTVK